MRVIATILGLAILAGGGFLIARMIVPGASEPEHKRESVLTGAYTPRLEEVGILEDADLPRGIEAPGIDSDTLYLFVVVLFPGAPNVPDHGAHKLDRINGVSDKALDPVHTSAEYVEGEGTYLELVYRIDGEFEHAWLVRDGKAIVERISLE